MRTEDNCDNELRNISEEFKNIIKEMDSELTKYSQRRNYEKKLSNLKENCENDVDIIKKITYEIDSLNFSIQNGELVPLLGCGDWCYPDINGCDNNYKDYIKQRFNDTSNPILKNMYIFIILNSNLSYEEIKSFIDKSLNLLNHYLTTENNVELVNDLLMTTFDKCMSLRYKKEDIKSLIVNYVKADFNDIFNIKHLIELMLSKRKVFKKDDFEGLDDICWDCAQRSRSITIIEFLSLGQKISQKLQSNKYKWFDEMGKTCEDFAEEKQDSMGQIIHLSEAMEYYQKGGNLQRIDEVSIKLKKAQKEFEPAMIHFKFDVSLAVNAAITEIYEKIPLDSNKFLEFLIHDKNEFLIPKLEKDDENYNNFVDAAPLLAVSGQLKFDNNYNIIQTLKNDDEEERISDSNNSQYSLTIKFQNIFLKEMFIYAHDLEVFTYDYVIKYLYNCQKFLNISDGEKPLLYYFKPIIKEYFKQLELWLSNDEYNYVLFIDSIVSKLEYLVRKLCDIYNISMLKPQGRRTTSEKLLHDFFSDPKFKEVLLENDYDFLKHVLLKPGLNLRNKSAHGFDLSIYTFEYANLLLLCFFRLLKYFIIIDDNYFQELEFFKYQNLDKTSEIIQFGLNDMGSKIDEFKTYLLFKLID